MSLSELPMTNEAIRPTDRCTSDLRVLVVDDDENMQALLGERLRIDGFEVDCVASAEQALIRYLCRRRDGVPYSVCLIDVRLGALAGTDLLRLIRAIDDELTVLVMSGCADLAVAVESLRDGADDYLGKPIKIWDLKARITTAFGFRHVIQGRTAEDEEQGLEWGGCYRNDGTRHAPTPEKKQDAMRNGTHSDDYRTDSVDLSDATSSVEVEPRPSSRSGTPEHDEMGRENGVELPRRRGIDTASGLGENRKGGPRLEDSEHPAGRDWDEQSRNDELPGFTREGTCGLGGPTERLGGSDEAWASSPLDALLELAVLVERETPGWERHAAAAADLATRLAARTSDELGLTPADLDAVQLALRLQSLGLIRHARGDERTQSPPKQVANLLVAMRVLDALRTETDSFELIDEDLARRAKELLASVDWHRIAARRTRRQGKRPTPEKHATDKKISPQLRRLAMLFEIVDLWTNLEPEEPESGLTRLEEHLASFAPDCEATTKPLLAALEHE